MTEEESVSFYKPDGSGCSKEEKGFVEGARVNLNFPRYNAELSLSVNDLTALAVRHLKGNPVDAVWLIMESKLSKVEQYIANLNERLKHIEKTLGVEYDI